MSLFVLVSLTLLLQGSFFEIPNSKMKFHIPKGFVQKGNNLISDDENVSLFVFSIKKQEDYFDESIKPKNLTNEEKGLLMSKPVKSDFGLMEDIELYKTHLDAGKSKVSYIMLWIAETETEIIIFNVTTKYREFNKRKMCKTMKRLAKSFKSLREIN